MRSWIAVAAVLPRAGVSGRAPPRMGSMGGVLKMRVRHAVRRSRARGSTTATIATRARPVPVPVPLPVPLSVAIPVPVPLSITLPVAGPLRSAPLSVHQIVSLDAAISILAVLVLVFMSAGMEEGVWR